MKEEAKIIYLDADNEIYFNKTDLYEGRYKVYKFSHVVSVTSQIKRIVTKEKK